MDSSKVEVLECPPQYVSNGFSAFKVETLFAGPTRATNLNTGKITWQHVNNKR